MPKLTATPQEDSKPFSEAEMQEMRSQGLDGNEDLSLAVMVNNWDSAKARAKARAAAKKKNGQ